MDCVHAIRPAGTRPPPCRSLPSPFSSTSASASAAHVQNARHERVISYFLSHQAHPPRLKSFVYGRNVLWMSYGYGARVSENPDPHTPRQTWKGMVVDSNFPEFWGKLSVRVPPPLFEQWGKNSTLLCDSPLCRDGIVVIKSTKSRKCRATV